MKIDVNTLGSDDIGRMLWVCDFRNNRDLRKKPYRNVRPCIAQIKRGRETAKWNMITFFEIKNGKLSKREIRPYSNEGWGEEINVFTTEEECREHYKDQVEVAIYELELHLKKYNESVKGKIDKLKYSIK